MVWGVAELSVALRRGGTRERRDPSFLPLVLGIGAGIGGAFAVADVDGTSLPGGGTWPVVVGLAILWAGVALRFWAIRTLGRFFTYDVTVEEGQHVVDTGPYRLVRHPSYTGAFIAYLGLGIALDNWLSIAAAVGLPLIPQLVRIAYEERALAEALGEDYRRYMERTKRLIPGVW